MNVGDALRRRRFYLSSLLVVVLIVFSLSPSITFAGTRERGFQDFIRSANMNSGGWGMRSVVISTVASAISEFHHSRTSGEAFDPSAVFAFARETTFWSGVAVDSLLSFAVAGVLPALPGGAFLHTFAYVGAGFVGFEIGSGNLRETNWLSIGAQTLSATVTQLALTPLLVSMGIPGAGLVAMTASIAVALTAAWLLERWQSSGSSLAQVRPARESISATFPAAAVGTEGFSSPLSVSEDVVSSADEAYRLFIRASQEGHREEAAHWLEEYRRQRSLLSQRRGEARESF